MANRFPLIFNSGAGQIQELAASDNLDLTSSNLVNAGILSTSSGSVTAPSLQIGSGTTYNPGLYSPGTDQLAVATNGVQRINIEADGDINIDGGGVFYDATNNRLAIGSTAPTGNLSFGATDAIINSDTSDASDNKSVSLAGGGTASTARGGYMQVYGNEYTTTGGVVDINSGNVANSYVRIQGRSSSSDIRFWINASEAGRFDSSGRLLIGTSTARSSINILSQTDLTPSVQFEGQSTSNRNTGLSIINYSASDYGSAFTLGASNSNTLGTNTLVESGADVGVINFVGADGTRFVSCASIVAKIDGTPGANDMPGRLEFSVTRDSASSPTEALRITKDGDLLIGTTGIDGRGGLTIRPNLGGSQTYCRMTFNGNNADDLIYFRYQDTQVGRITITTTATTYGTSSDYRLKENVIPIADGITRLKQLKPNRFNFIVDSSHTVDGFIAHEAQAVVPECIVGQKDEIDDEGNPVYQSIDQSKLVPLLTAALQEAIAKIETLEQRLTAAGID